MSPPTTGDRLVSAAVGAVFGVIIGCAVAWLFGVYSNTMGAATVVVNFKHWVLWSSAGFALLGLLLGSHAGTVVGMVIGAIFEFESPSESHVPQWVVVLVLSGAAIGAWWWLSK